MPRRGFQHRTAGSRRLTQWIGPAAQSYQNVASTGATLLAFVSFEEQTTVVRTRGQVSVRLQAFGVDLDIIGAFGMGVVSTEAFLAGVASIPEPFTDADWGGWFVWRSFSYHLEFNDVTGIESFLWDFEVDSKAMRKISPNETIVIIAESLAGAYAISAPLRVLVKLS